MGEAKKAATGNSKGLFTLPQQHCTNVWKYKNVAFTLEKCSNALKAVIERVISEAEAKSREVKKKKRASSKVEAPGFAGVLRSTSKKDDYENVEEKLSEEEIRERVSKFSRNDAAWTIQVEMKEIEGVFQCIRECQLGHMSLSK